MQKQHVPFEDPANQPQTPEVLVAMQSTETVPSQKFLDTLSRDVTASASLASTPFSWTASYKLPANWTTTYKAELDIYNAFASQGSSLVTCILELLARCTDLTTGLRNKDAYNLSILINTQKEIHVNDLYRCIATYQAAQNNDRFEQFRKACKYIIIQTQHFVEAEAAKLETQTPAVTAKPDAPYSWTQNQRLPDHWWMPYPSQIHDYAHYLKLGNSVTNCIIQVLARCPAGTGTKLNAHATMLTKLIQGLKITDGQKEPHVNDLFRCIANYHDRKDTNDESFETYRQVIKYIIIAREHEKEMALNASNSKVENRLN